MTKEKINYFTRKIADSNPTQIIAVIFEMTEAYIDEAISAHECGNFDEFMTNLNRASKCVNDLIESLDLQYEIANQLLEIYLFINKEIANAIIKNDIDNVVAIREMIRKLKISFQELAKSDDSGAAMGNAQEGYAGLTYGKGMLNESTTIQSNRGFTV